MGTFPENRRVRRSAPDLIHDVMVKVGAGDADVLQGVAAMLDRKGTL